jgi:hypothetical protein
MRQNHDNIPVHERTGLRGETGYDRNKRTDFLLYRVSGGLSLLYRTKRNVVIIQGLKDRYDFTGPSERRILDRINMTDRTT